MGKIFLIFLRHSTDRWEVVIEQNDSLKCIMEVFMSYSKIIIVSDDPVVVHRGQEFAQTLGVQCEVQAPGYASQGMPSLSSGSNPLAGSNVLQFPGVQNSVQGSQVATINDLEAQAIEKAIQSFRGNLTEAAKALGIGRATLYRKVKLYNIDPSQARRRRAA
jgi:Bacterial regulatory protein, Fis family